MRTLPLHQSHAIPALHTRLLGFLYQLQLLALMTIVRAYTNALCVAFGIDFEVEGPAVAECEEGQDLGVAAARYVVLEACVCGREVGG